MRVALSILLVMVTRTVTNVYNGSITDLAFINRTYNRVIYKEGKYLVDYDTGTGNNYTCLEEEICVKKCCRFGLRYDRTTSRCVNIEVNFNPRAWEGSLMKEAGIDASKRFIFVENSFNCPQNVAIISITTDTRTDYEFTTDGKLRGVNKDNVANTSLFNYDQYCLDHFVDANNKTFKDGLLCYTVKIEPNQYHIEHNRLNASCMFISCFFIIMTVAVYIFLPNLRNTVPGMITIAFLLSFFVFFVCMSTMQVMIDVQNISRLQCVTLTFIIYFAMNAGFFWLNVMCYDVWKRFRVMSVRNRHVGTSNYERNKFLRYCSFGFGIPTALTIMLAAIEFTSTEFNVLLPNVRLGTCFLGDTSRMIYVYTPMLFACICNFVFIALATIKIVQTNKDTQRLQRKDKQRFLVFIKLFVLTGFSWILEVISSFYPQYEYLWRFSDAYNVLFGVIIFLLFVCKKKIFNDIKERYQILKGNHSTLKAVPTMTTCLSQENIEMPKSN